MCFWRYSRNHSTKQSDRRNSVWLQTPHNSKNSVRTCSVSITPVHEVDDGAVWCLDSRISMELQSVRMNQNKPGLLLTVLKTARPFPGTTFISIEVGRSWRKPGFSGGGGSFRALFLSVLEHAGCTTNDFVCFLSRETLRL